MKKLQQWPWKNISIGVLALLLLGVFVGGGNGFDVIPQSLKSFSMVDGEESMSYGGVAMGANRAMMTTDEYDASTFLPPQPDANTIAGEVTQRELIRTGNLSLIVADVEQSQKEIKNKVEAWDGILEESNLNRLDDDRQSGWMRVRVPSEQFDMAFEELKSMALKVDSESTRVDDVTGQVVDQKARLVNLRTEEAQYLAILEKAESVEEVLQATEYLNRVRNNIEWAERSLKSVTEQVSLSTLYINLIDEGDVEVLGVYWTPWLNVKKSARAAVENITVSVDQVVAFVLNLPLLLVWLLIAYGVFTLGVKGLRKIGLL